MPDKNSIRVAIVGGIRTPFLKANTAFKKYTSLELGTHAVQGLIEKFNLSAKSLDELVYGWVITDPRVPNMAREIVFRTGLPATIKAHTVSNNCITGIHAITSIYDSIREGRTEIGIAGGAESMSNPPVMFGKRASRVFLDIAVSKSFGSKIAHGFKIRPGFFKPNAPAIEEPSTGLSMGEHTELMAKEWKITREEQDNIAFMSHMNAHKATEDGRLKAEIFPIDKIDRDLIIRSDTTMEKLGKLKPVFDKGQEGTITAGNSSPLTDGASAVLLMSDERAKKEGFEPLAYIKGFEYSAINTSDGLLMAPAVAVPRLLRRTGLSLKDMDIIEMHEAFGAQVTSNMRAWEKGWKEEPIGKVDMEKLNPLGSSIAVGHPFAATGGRIVTTLSNEMKRREAKYGFVSICAAGAMAAAMILERN